MTTTATTPRIRLPWRAGLSATRLPATRHVEPHGGKEGAVVGRLPRRWAPRSADSVAQSWRRQVLLVRVGGTTVRIQARLDEDAYGGVRGDQGEHPWPFAGDVLVAGSARGPIAYLAGELHTGRDALRSQAETYLVRTAPADLVDRGHAWTEPAVIATGRSSASPIRPDWPERFLEACGRLGIDTVVRIRDGQWEVLSLAGGDVDDARVVSSDPCSVTRDVDRRCVLLRAPEKGEYCRMRGGPWVRRSIEASLAWKHHRAQLVGPLGCDTCDGVRYLFQDQVREGGGPIGLVELAVPTRWLVAVEE
jgi:hypothetical protein